MVVGPIAAVVLVLVLAPLGMLFYVSFRPPGSFPIGLGVTLENYVTVLSLPQLPLYVGNTLTYAVPTAVLALAFGTFMAWITWRTDVPGRRLLHLLIFSSFATPLMIKTFGWILLADPRIGALNQGLRRVLGDTGGVGPLNIYSMGGMIFVSTLGLSAIVYTIVSPAVMRMDPSFEEAGLAAGARPASVLRVVVLPSLRPALLSAFLYVLLIAIATLETPLVLGLQARITVLSTYIYRLVTSEGSVPDYGIMATFGIFMSLTSVAIIAMYLRLTRLAEKYRTVGSGSKLEPRRTQLGRWRYVVLGVAGLYLATMYLPILVMALNAFLPAPFPIAGLDSLTLKNFGRIAGMGLVRDGIVNTALLGLTTATAVVMVTGLSSWISNRWKGKRWLESLTILPLGFPSIVLALAVLFGFVWTPIHGSIWVISIGLTISQMPIGMRILSSSMIQVHRSLDESALTAGARPLTVLRTIVVPLVTPSIAYTWLYVFVHSIRDFTFPLMLATSQSLVVATAIWLLWSTSGSDLNGACALSLLLILFGLAVITVGSRLGTPERR